MKKTEYFMHIASFFVICIVIKIAMHLTKLAIDLVFIPIFSTHPTLHVCVVLFSIIGFFYGYTILVKIGILKIAKFMSSFYPYSTCLVTPLLAISITVLLIKMCSVYVEPEALVIPSFVEWWPWYDIEIVVIIIAAMGIVFGKISEQREDRIQ